MFHFLIDLLFLDQGPQVIDEHLCTVQASRHLSATEVRISLLRVFHMLVPKFVDTHEPRRTLADCKLAFL